MKKKKQVANIKKPSQIRVQITRNKLMLEIALKKDILGWLIVAELRHSYFSDYHKRFDHKKEDIYSKCGQKRLKSYLFRCSGTKTLRVKLFSIIDRKLLTQKEVLGTMQVIKMFAK